MIVATVDEKPVTPLIDGLAPDDRKLRNRRVIADPAILSERVEKAWRDTDDHLAFRTLLLDLLRQALDDGREEIKIRFMRKNDGAEAVLAQAYLMDTLIRAIHDAATSKLYRASNPTHAEQICVIAVGGYGRGELAPFSDIDLLFLLPYKQTPHVEQVVEAILYIYGDLRLKVGHSTR